MARRAQMAISRWAPICAGASASSSRPSARSISPSASASRAGGPSSVTAVIQSPRSTILNPCYKLNSKRDAPPSLNAPKWVGLNLRIWIEVATGNCGRCHTLPRERHPDATKGPGKFAPRWARSLRGRWPLGLRSTQALADGVGFEPTDAFTSPVFKTGALNRSATHPTARRSSGLQLGPTRPRRWAVQGAG